MIGHLLVQCGGRPYIEEVEMAEDNDNKVFFDIESTHLRNVFGGDHYGLQTGILVLGSGETILLSSQVEMLRLVSDLDRSRMVLALASSDYADRSNSVLPSTLDGAADETVDSADNQVDRADAVLDYLVLPKKNYDEIMRQLSVDVLGPSRSGIAQAAAVVLRDRSPEADAEHVDPFPRSPRRDWDARKPQRMGGKKRKKGGR